jgi:hypothetical protein
MGKYSNGILGAFSGKVGPVVGASWNGKAYMRSYTKKIRNPQTPAQMMQRSKVSIVSKFIRPVRGIINVGWKQYANGMTPANAATRYMLANAIIGDYPNYDIDPEKVLISSGSLATATGATATAAAGKVTITWSDNSGTSSAEPTDKALIAVINPEKSEAVYQDNAAERTAATLNVSLPTHWAGDTVICYIGFISENRKHVANSVYLGEVTVS